MQYDELIHEVRERASLEDRADVDAAISATLQTLAERLAGGETTDLAAQLPGEVKHLLEGHEAPGERWSAEEFLERVAGRLGTPNTSAEARIRARAVLSSITESISDGETAHLLEQLPRDFEPLLR